MVEVAPTKASSIYIQEKLNTFLTTTKACLEAELLPPDLLLVFVFVFTTRR